MNAAGRKKFRPGIDRRARTPEGKAVQRRWPFDSLALYEQWSAVLTHREAQSARNCAFQYGQRTGKKFSTARYPLSARRVSLIVERVA